MPNIKSAFFLIHSILQLRQMNSYSRMATNLSAQKQYIECWFHPHLIQNRKWLAARNVVYVVRETRLRSAHWWRSPGIEKVAVSRAKRLANIYIWLILKSFTRFFDFFWFCRGIPWKNKALFMCTKPQIKSNDQFSHTLLVSREFFRFNKVPVSPFSPPCHLLLSIFPRISPELEILVHQLKHSTACNSVAAKKSLFATWLLYSVKLLFGSHLFPKSKQQQNRWERFETKHRRIE